MKLTWDNAPKDATHQHQHSSMFYRVDGDKVHVWSKKNGWSNSKVKADSQLLTPRPTKETEVMKPLTIEASSPEELAEKLSAIGLSNDEVAELVLEITGETVAHTEECETCDCGECSGMSRAEAGMVVGQKLAKLLKGIKQNLELDFDVQEVMNTMGFVKTETTTAEERETEILLEKLEPVAKQLVEETGMPPQVAIAGMMQVFRALDAHGLIKH